MRLTISIFKAAVAASCFALAACGGDSTAGSTSSSDNSTAATVLKAAAVAKASTAIAASTASANGTTIPSATNIIDGSGNVWSVTAGVIYENGAPAGYSNAVTLLIYFNNTIYQQNAAGGWWWWNGSTWVAGGDPRNSASVNGTTIPSATDIIDGSGNEWSVADGVVYENGALAGYTNSVTLLLYVNNTIYQENAAGGWWSWNANTWVSSSDPRVSVSANGATIPAVSQIIDASGNVWAVNDGVVYENGVLAGYSNGVTQLVYENNTVYQENAAGGWWSWNGSTWASGTDPVGGTGGTAGTGGTTGLSVSGNPQTVDGAGQPYSFVPTTSNIGGGALTFSIANMPPWASFNTATGALTGTPGISQVGTYSNILISVSNGSLSASLPAFSITVCTGAATLSWTAPTTNTNGTPLTDLAGYTIYYGTDASDLTQTIQVPTPNTTSYEISNLPAGTYYFAVAAYNADGMQSDLSSVGSKTIL